MEFGMEEEKKNKTMGAIVDINVTPMVDVMLVLLIIFMVITPMLSKGVSVDLVRTRNHIAMDEADQEDAILVAVTREGSVFLGRSRIEAAQLKNEVEDILTTRIDKTVYVKSDARSRYERVVEVVNILRSAGCDQVGLLTEKLEETRSRAAQ
jgi:biopolymer transport protein ExbD/biopolymer transport protein TolR